MSRWTIYNKSGEVLHESITEYDGNGEIVYADTLEYTGSWMGECFVTLKVRSAYPINFQVGDYIDYRGERFTLNYDPSVIKKARRGTYGEGFTYDGIKFNARHTELTDVRFLDYVLGDNGLHWTSLPDFSFYAASIDDFCDRLQANTNRWCEANNIAADDSWLFLTPDLTRTKTRATSAGMSDSEATSRWNAAYGEGTDVTEEKKDLSITVSNQSVWESLAMIKNNFGLNFINRDRSVIVGSAGIPTSHIFEYGKGNGLYEIERVADTEQQIITKLYGYGTSKNLPVRYYANIGITCYAEIASFTSGELTYLYIDIANDSGCFTTKGELYTVSGYIVSVKAEGSDDSTAEQAVLTTMDEAPDGSSVIVFDSGSTLAVAGTRIEFVSGCNFDKWPAAYKNYPSESALPNNMAVNRLMLPGFPEKSLKAWALENGGYTNTDGSVTWNGYTAFFSDEQYNPYVLSVNYTTLGIREGIKTFDGSDDGEEIYPTIENTGKDTIASAEMITDNGVYTDGENEPTVTLTLPDLGFDLKEYAQNGESPTIVMKDGYCGARSFSILTDSNSNYRISQNDSGQWVCVCKREHDDLLDLWFPYSYAVSMGGTATADEPYQVRSGDKYVLTGIYMPDTYIESASVKLLEYTLAYLKKNDYARYTYTPKIDEIYMARQHQEAEETETTSLYQTLKEGDLLYFEDTDLLISDAKIFIDTLSIKENGNANIPTFDVTLRNDKQVGTIQRILETINSLSNGSSGGVGGNGVGNYSTNQINAMIAAYGGKRFLSKLSDDSAAGLITFIKGLISQGTLTFEGILKSDGAINDFLNGNGIYMDAEQGLIQTDALEVRGFMKIMELVINRLQLMESDYSFTEGGTIEHIDIAEDGQSMTYTVHKEHDNDILPFYENDILYAKVNNLDTEGTYFTSWVRVVSVDQDENTMVVVPYVGYDTNGPIVPGGVNFTPKGTEIEDDYGVALLADYELYPDGFDTHMNVTRHGNVTNTERQQSWVLSTTDKRLSFFWNVTQPIIEDENYALCLGILPDLANLPSTRNKSMPSLYVNTVFADHYDKANYPAKIIKEDRGQWSATPTGEYTGSYDGTFTPDGTLVATDEDLADYADWIAVINGYAGTYASGDTISENYHYKTFTMDRWLTYRLDTSHYGSLSDKKLFLKMVKEWREEVDLEVSRVWKGSKMWECLVDGTTDEPGLYCTDWRLMSGDTLFGIAFSSSNGTSFYQGYVDTTVTSYLYWGQEDITDIVDASCFVWTRSSESGKTAADTAWDAMSGHSGSKTLTLTSDDMPTAWSRTNKAIFTLTVTIGDESVENTIIA